MAETFTNFAKLSNPLVGDCGWDDDWHNNQFTQDVLHWQSCLNNGIVSGCELVTPVAMQINNNAGVAYISGVEVEVSDGLHNLISGATGVITPNFIYVDSLGAVNVTIVPPSTGAFAMLGVVSVADNVQITQSDIRRIMPFNYNVVQTPVENKCINGEFWEWQRSTSSSLSGYQTADMWFLGFSGVTATLSRSDIPPEHSDGLKYQAQLVQSASSLASDFLLLRYRAIDILQYAGNRVFFGFEVYQETAAEVAVAATMIFGSGGSANVNLTGLKYATQSATWITIEGFFDIPSIGPGTVIGDGDCLQLRIFTTGGANYDAFTDNLGHQPANTTFFRDGKIYISEKPVPVRRRTAGETKFECQYYYQEFPVFLGNRYNPSDTTCVSQSNPFLRSMRVPPHTIAWDTPTAQANTATVGTVNNVVLSGINTDSTFGITFQGTGFTTAINCLRVNMMKFSSDL